MTEGEIKIDIEKVNSVLENIFPALEECVFAKEVNGDDMYFAMMVLLYINQISAQQNGITPSRLHVIEIAAAKHIKKYHELHGKYTMKGFYN